MTGRGRALAAAGTVAATAGLLLVALPAVGAADVFDNVAPASQLPGGALMDRYPLGAYLLDHHFDAVKAGVPVGVDVSGIPPTIAWFLAQLLWQLTALLAYATITVFTWAFSLDLVNGSAATGGSGALAPVSGGDRHDLRQRLRRAVADRRDRRDGHVGDVAVARAPPPHRDARRAGHVAPLRRDRAGVRDPARAHDRPGVQVDQRAVGRVSVAVGQRHHQRPRRRQARGQRPALQAARARPLGRLELRRAGALRQRQRRLGPCSAAVARPGPRRATGAPARARTAGPGRRQDVRQQRRQVRAALPAVRVRDRRAQRRVRGAEGRRQLASCPTPTPASATAPTGSARSTSPPRRRWARAASTSGSGWRS